MEVSLLDGRRLPVVGLRLEKPEVAELELAQDGYDKVVRLWSDASWTKPLAEVRSLPAFPFYVLTDIAAERIVVVDQTG